MLTVFVTLLREYNRCAVHEDLSARQTVDEMMVGGLRTSQSVISGKSW